ncbi:Peptidase A1 domain-containing protein [Aphelenchoides besseyi]|nr:Peptidase A1 domain-containing protein [Aphelenchoides besseyi]
MFRLTILIVIFVGGILATPPRQKFTVAPFYNVKGTMIQLIGLGTPTQPTTMELSVATPDFFVIPTNCKTQGCTKNRKGYDTAKSSTFNEPIPSKPFGTLHMGAQSTGRLATDALTALAIPGKAPPMIPLPLVDTPKGALVDGYATGLMGWGFLPKDSKLPGTFLQGMLKNLDALMFEVYLQSYKHTRKEDIQTYGNVTYGNKDTNHCNEAHFFVKTDNPRAWEIKMDYARIGSTKIKGGSALFYPGSPRVHAPSSVVKAIRSRIHAKYDKNLKEYYVDCKAKKQLPMLRLVFHKRVFAFYPREYLVQSEGSNKCLLMISGPSKRYKGADWIIGDPMLREHCWLFDFNGPRIGFTKHKGK